MRVPVLIPAYNSRATLEETLRSVAGQSVNAKHLISKVIVADDGSTDGTAEVAQSVWSESGIPLEIWRREQNRGERHTVNEAFAKLLAEGNEWCAVLHADDIAKPTWMELLVPRADHAAPDVVSICSSWDNLRSDHVVPGEDNPEREDEKIPGDVSTAAGTLGRGCWWHFSGCLMNLRNFDSTGGFCEDMPQLGDFEWLVRALRGGLSVIYVPRTLIWYREHAGNVSSISFRTNRDLRETLLICDRHSHDEALRSALISYGFAGMRNAFRRFLTSFLRGRMQRGFASLALFVKMARMSVSLRLRKPPHVSRGER